MRIHFTPTDHCGVLKVEFPISDTPRRVCFLTRMTQSSPADAGLFMEMVSTERYGRGFLSNRFARPVGQSQTRGIARHIGALVGDGWKARLAFGNSRSGAQPIVVALLSDRTTTSTRRRATTACAFVLRYWATA
jgi:hypothetical protein